MQDWGAQLDDIWQMLRPMVPANDPLRADVDEYLEATEWGIAAEAMAILSKRYNQDLLVLPLLQPVMEHLIAAENEKESQQG